MSMTGLGFSLSQALTVSASNPGISLQYDDGSSSTNSGTVVWDFGGTPINLADGESTIFTWSIPSHNPGGSFSLQTVTVAQQIPEPSHAVMLTGLITIFVMGHRRRIRS